MTSAFAIADGRLILPAALDHRAAARLHRALCDSVREAGGLRIDAGAVERLSLSCVQVLVAAASGDAPPAIEHPSAAFLAAFEELGFDCRGVVETLRAPPPAPSAAAPMRILTIDDSRTIRQMLLMTLEAAGFDVMQAVDGQDGLAVLGREKIDLVITDINMPRLDGYGVIRAMRADPAHRVTPILVLTTESEMAKKNSAREAGATGWVVKPFEPGLLVETIRKVAP